MENPFEILDARLAVIENLLLELKSNSIAPKSLDEYISSEEIIGKYCGRTTFYQHVKNGTIKIYKLGNKTFVKSEEFFSSEVFIPVSL